jgi:hypothetical protein
MYRGYRIEGKKQAGGRDHDAQNWLRSWRQSFGNDRDRSEACDA